MRREPNMPPQAQLRHPLRAPIDGDVCCWCSMPWKARQRKCKLCGCIARGPAWTHRPHLKWMARITWRDGTTKAFRFYTLAGVQEWMDAELRDRYQQYGLDPSDEHVAYGHLTGEWNGYEPQPLTDHVRHVIWQLERQAAYYEEIVETSVWLYDIRTYEWRRPTNKEVFTPMLGGHRKENDWQPVKGKWRNMPTLKMQGVVTAEKIELEAETMDEIKAALNELGIGGGAVEVLAKAAPGKAAKAAEPEAEGEEEDKPKRTRRSSKKKTTKKKTSRRKAKDEVEDVDDEDEDEDDEPEEEEAPKRRSRRRKKDDEDDEEEKPKRRSRRRARDEDDEDDEEEDDEPPAKGAKVVSINKKKIDTEKLAGMRRIKDVVLYLIDECGLDSVDDVVAMCNDIKEDVGVLKKAMDLEDRVQVLAETALS